MRRRVNRKRTASDSERESHELIAGGASMQILGSLTRIGREVAFSGGPGEAAVRGRTQPGLQVARQPPRVCGMRKRACPRRVCRLARQLAKLRLLWPP